MKADQIRNAPDGCRNGTLSIKQRRRLLATERAVASKVIQRKVHASGLISGNHVITCRRSGRVPASPAQRGGLWTPWASAPGAGGLLACLGSRFQLADNEMTYFFKSKHLGFVKLLYFMFHHNSV